MNERLKELRKDYLHLTLEKFGEPLGVKHNTVSQLENGKNKLTDQMILSICRTYNVNEEWLRTGKGSVFNDISRFTKISEWVGLVMSEYPATFKSRFINMLYNLDESEWIALEKRALSLLPDSSTEQKDD